MMEKGEEDNPFSFKKFVKKKDDSDLEFSDEEVNLNEVLKSGAQKAAKSSKQLIIADDADSAENPFSFKSFMQTSPQELVQTDPSDFSESESDKEDTRADNIIDRSMPTAICPNEPPTPELASKMAKENERLRIALKKSEQRVQDIEKAMKKQSQKDAEETKALEKMLLQVEANLKASVERAVAAEQTISRLKNELASLKKHQDPSHSHAMKDKAKMAAEQISTAASAAESHMKQMNEGVKTLRLWADVLSSLDSISEQ